MYDKFAYFLQLLLGKDHIHVQKWTKSKPNREYLTIVIK